MRISIGDIQSGDVIGWSSAQDVAGTLPTAKVVMLVESVEELDPSETSPELGGYRLEGDILGEEYSTYSEGEATVKLPQKKVTKLEM